jgi:hypothetical protein
MSYCAQLAALLTWPPPEPLTCPCVPDESVDRRASWILADKPTRPSTCSRAGENHRLHIPKLAVQLLSQSSLRGTYVGYNVAVDRFPQALLQATDNRPT